MTTCFALALAGSGAAAAQAAAATIAVTQACVVNASATSGSQMTVNGTGFNPGDMINLQTTTGDAFSTATADSGGNFTIQMQAPTLNTFSPAAASFTLQAMDETDGATTASASFDVANLAVSTNPARAKPNKKVMWSFSGFTSGAEIYAHYLHGKKVTATMKFGRAGGPCGVLKKRAVFYPGHAKYGSYKIQIDDVRRYSASTLPRLVATLKTHLTL